MKIKKNVNNILFIWSAVLLVGYLGMFAFLNLAKYDQHVDSDTAAEALLGKIMWEEKSLTPDTWIASSERHNFGAPTLTAVLYGITGNLSLSQGISCTILGLLFAWVLYAFMREQGFSKMATVVSMLVLCAIPINGIKLEGQMVPFLHQLLFVFADYYVLHSMVLLLAVLLYIRLRKQEFAKKNLILWILLFGLTLGLSLGGQRLLQILIFPLLVYEIICLFIETKAFALKVDKKRLAATGFVVSMAVAFGLASFYPGQIHNPMELGTPEQVVEKVFTTIPAMVLDGFGLAGNVALGSFGSIMQLLVWAFLALVIMGLVVMFQKDSQATMEQKMGLLILCLSLGITIFLVAITTVGPVPNYFYVEWFIALYVVAYLVDHYGKKDAWFKEMIVVAVCAFALLNIGYTYADALSTEDNLVMEQEVADFLTQQDIQYGYGAFWDAGRIALLTDEKVKMGHSYTMTDVKMQWWLTDLRWYPPNLPTKMPVAYIVRQAERDGFENWYGENLPDIRFENEKFVVYIGEENKVLLP